MANNEQANRERKEAARGHARARSKGVFGRFGVMQGKLDRKRAHLFKCRSHSTNLTDRPWAAQQPPRERSQPRIDTRGERLRRITLVEFMASHDSRGSHLHAHQRLALC
ncbi:hypothetical protein CBOM_07756 [Ceraceosorus bombacis]|uniref:Uncharacterized protein n=1 Tax=Ceraceosorus bombacis TaxID=401625 RepID=A0A0P1BP64_9BASI|nr:hypothetical protein CBOM_07756 [Ceraceosorus bombacis]